MLNSCVKRFRMLPLMNSRHCLHATAVTALLAVGLLAAAPAMAEFPPITGPLSPSSGASVTQATPGGTLSVEYPCPNGWYSYEVTFATSPELNPAGELATPFRIMRSPPSPVNAAENICQSNLLSPAAEKPQTVYWQVATHAPCAEPSCNAKGPVWSFNIIAPAPISSPAPSPEPTPITSPVAKSESYGCEANKEALRSAQRALARSRKHHGEVRRKARRVRELRRRVRIACY
jgi:hypothetical protein